MLSEPESTQTTGSAASATARHSTVIPECNTPSLLLLQLVLLYFLYFLFCYFSLFPFFSSTSSLSPPLAQFTFSFFSFIYFYIFIFVFTPSSATPSTILKPPTHPLPNPHSHTRAHIHTYTHLQQYLATASQAVTYQCTPSSQKSIRYFPNSGNARTSLVRLPVAGAHFPSHQGVPVYWSLHPGNTHTTTQ